MMTMMMMMMTMTMMLTMMMMMMMMIMMMMVMTMVMMMMMNEHSGRLFFRTKQSSQEPESPAKSIKRDARHNLSREING
eukprot:5484946-Amphidinium_carterae.1